MQVGMLCGVGPFNTDWIMCSMQCSSANFNANHPIAKRDPIHPSAGPSKPLPQLHASRAPGRVSELFKLSKSKQIQCSHATFGMQHNNHVQTSMPPSLMHHMQNHIHPPPATSVPLPQLLAREAPGLAPTAPNCRPPWAVNGRI